MTVLHVGALVATAGAVALAVAGLVYRFRRRRVPVWLHRAVIWAALAAAGWATAAGMWAVAVVMAATFLLAVVVAATYRPPTGRGRGSGEGR